ncbi:hypothetical protein D3C72_987690 [compost metagenome]
MNGFSDAHHTRLASANQAAIDRQDARADWLAGQRSRNSIFDPRFKNVRQEAFRNFDPDTLEAISGLFEQGKNLEAGEKLCEYLHEVCQEEIDEILETEAEEAGRDW